MQHLFSKAKPLRSPRLVSLNSFNFDQKHCNASKGFRALSVYSILLKMIKAGFISFTFFFRFSIMCRRVFNKTILFYLGLLDMK